MITLVQDTSGILTVESILKHLTESLSLTVDSEMKTSPAERFVNTITEIAKNLYERNHQVKAIRLIRTIFGLSLNESRVLLEQHIK